MKNDHAFEALLRKSLNRRGAPAPFAIDVADSVMARVAELGAAPRSELSFRQLGWWAAAAALMAAALTAAVLWQAPSLATTYAILSRTMADAIEAAVKIAQPAGSLAGTLGRVVLSLASSIRSLVGPLEPFQPLARLMLLGVAATMLSITTFVVGRDVRARIADKERA